MLPVTSMVAAAAAVALVALSIAVSLQRMKAGVKLGFGEDATLMQRIRAQGNFTEYVPLALILLGLAEYRGVSTSLLFTIAALLIAGRTLHLIGITTGKTAISAPGMLGTYGALLLGAGAVVLG